MNDQGTAREPVAIIGIGCHLPGARGPEAFWKLLRDGVDALTEIPPDRFDIDAYHNPRPGIPGKIVTRRGGFVGEIDQFDPYFLRVDMGWSDWSCSRGKRLDEQAYLASGN